MPKTIFFVLPLFATLCFGGEYKVYKIRIDSKSFELKVVSCDGERFDMLRGADKKSTGNILISFSKDMSVSAFEAKHKVKLLRKGEVWTVFKNESTLNSLQLCDRIIKIEGDAIKTATPDWISDAKAF